MSDSYHIVLLPGDGIGPEVLGATRSVLEALVQFFDISLEFEEFSFGGAGIVTAGAPLTDEVLAACLKSDAILLGAIGGPQWDHLSADARPESGLLRLRSELGVYANLRPVSVEHSLAHLSVLPSSRVAGTDLLVVRELTGGIYFGQPREYSASRAFDTMVYTVEEIERIALVAFEWARKRRKNVVSVDKANVLAVSRLWRETVTRIGQTEFEDVELRHLYVDNAAMQMVLDPLQFDVVLTSNLFGDILSDLSSTLAGSLGLLPSASIGGLTPLFEPVHGSAPSLAGTDSANPVASILSAALMLDELGQAEAAEHIRRAVSRVLEAGFLTADLTGPGQTPLSTSDVVSKLISALEESGKAKISL